MARRADPSDSASDRDRPASDRIDRWLWHARFLRTRALAAALVSAGRVRVNGQRVVKPGHAVRVGDALTLPVGSAVRVVRVLGVADRRGPASAAQQLYHDLDGDSPAPGGHTVPDPS